MKLLLMADDMVGEQITAFLIENYINDLALVVTTSKNRITEICEKADVPTRALGAGFAMPDVDLGILAWWPKIISEPLISYPKYGFINTHPSFLPYNRGKHTSFWAIVEQRTFGVTLHMVKEGVDSGPIVAQRAIAYDMADTGETLYKKGRKEMVDLFEKSYPNIRKLDFAFVVQTPQGPTHKEIEIVEASRIDLDKEYTARGLINLLRAKTFPPWSGCRFSDNGVDYEILVKIRRL